MKMLKRFITMHDDDIDTNNKLPKVFSTQNGGDDEY